MAKKTIADINVEGKKVLIRCDFNVPLNDKKEITDDARIAKALPSIKNALEGGACVILMSHLGRPKGERNMDFSLAPVAQRLSELLGKDVIFAEDCIGSDVQANAANLKPGDVMLLENLRFHKAETIKDKAAKEDHQLREAKDNFAQEIADLADVYVCDAFGTAHRDNASMLTVPQMMSGKPCVAGFLIEKEIKFLGETIEAGDKPFVAILGGAKVSDKLQVIENLMDKVNTIIIGGGMSFTFAKAMGENIGSSLCEEDFVEKAGELMERAKDGNCEILLPVDTVEAKEFKADAENKVVEGSIDDGWLGLDIGPKTADMFADKIKNAKTVVWNGPMGVFEMEAFAKGTKAVAFALADATSAGARTVIGGGDSASAIKVLGLEDKVSHVSTGGGASLEMMEGKKFACLAILEDK
ncbi:Bifunctional PGK/TIM [Sedimentisphaera cyanobacteriorum]|uniref:Phosphoglycerate kinase n=1 Tax=Sedimentisphaera cyanobacteriorum TaxID=1940790 RepID=A0A1Q2HMV1_9BACT|nr:phosphoglycerate kinase [Sedimentisphaera cyanobacteriorum]AQQ08758.1 Bifunctional PGK/TIM [Sedimentisphaera cyanobacteriorum]